MNYIGQGSIDEYESACIVVDINMHRLKNQVKKARKIIEEHDFVTMVEILANDPDEIDSQVFDDLDLAGDQFVESYELHPFRGEYKEEPEHYLRYATFEVTNYSVYYVCSPKHWNGRLSLHIEVKT